jgi:hypothetical protein
LEALDVLAAVDGRCLNWNRGGDLGLEPRAVGADGLRQQRLAARAARHAARDLTDPVARAA